MENLGGQGIFFLQVFESKLGASNYTPVSTTFYVQVLCCELSKLLNFIHKCTDWLMVVCYLEDGDNLQ